MENNPYAAPTAHVEDIVRGAAAPPLWNPNAAAVWSLLFTPIFGAWLQMKNWQALGEAKQAAASRAWAIGNLVVFVGVLALAVLAPETKLLDSVTRILQLVLLISWYVNSARTQVRFVKERFGTGYPRRGWAKPLLIGVGLWIVFLGVTVAAVLGLGSAD